MLLTWTHSVHFVGSHAPQQTSLHCITYPLCESNLVDADFGNAFPFRSCVLSGTWELGRKDSLYRNVAAARRLKGAAFDFIPK
jgi:hypothetical protein